MQEMDFRVSRRARSRFYRAWACHGVFHTLPLPIHHYRKRYSPPTDTPLQNGKHHYLGLKKSDRWSTMILTQAPPPDLARFSFNSPGIDKVPAPPRFPQTYRACFIELPRSLSRNGTSNSVTCRSHHAKQTAPSGAGMGSWRVDRGSIPTVDAE